MKKVSIHLEQKEPLVVGNKIFRCANDFRLTEFDLEIARRENNETEEKTVKCLKELKGILSEDLSLVYSTDDDVLLRYLRKTKFDCKMAHKAMKKFYEAKAEHADLFLLSPQLEKYLETNFIRRLPYKTENGCFVFWISIGNWKIEDMSFDNLLQLIFSVMDITSMIPCTQVNGLVDIFDFKGFTTSHVTEFVQIRRLLLLSKFLLNVYPWRLRRVILVNFYSWMHTCYKAIRPFLKKKIAERIIILGSDVTELHQHVDPLILPKEYGGCVDEKECSLTHSVMNNLDYLKYQRSFGKQ